MSAPRGRTPCLIGTTLGTPSIVRTGARGALRQCKRCNANLPRGAVCVQVSLPGQLGHKSYCPVCFRKILDATQERLDELRQEVDAAATASITP